MKKLKQIFIFTVSVLLLVSPCVNAEYVDDQKGTLRGIKRVGVIVEGLSPEAISNGLTKDRLKTDVELKLMMAGIKVLSKEERAPGAPFLYVNVNLHLHSSGLLFAHNICVSLIQGVYLARNLDIFCYTETWDRCKVGTVRILTMEEYIRKSVKDHVDVFLNDYLAVNPKQASTPKKK